MTTAITVDAHAGLPVKVQAIDLHGDLIKDPVVTDLDTVQPGEIKTFYAHATRQILIEELPAE